MIRQNQSMWYFYTNNGIIMNMVIKKTCFRYPIESVPMFLVEMRNRVKYMTFYFYYVYSSMLLRINGFV